MVHVLGAFDLIPAEIAVLDRSGRIAWANRAWNAIACKAGLGAQRGRLNYLRECEAAADRGCAEAMEVAAGIRSVLDGSVPAFTSIYSCGFDGYFRWYQVSVAPIPDAGAIVMHTDVTAAQRDALTGLANRALFDAHAAYVLGLAQESGEPAAVLIMDLNGFKPVNDEHGHLAGDHVLRLLATRIAEAMRPGDLAARFGGDEFAVMLAPGSDRASADAATRRIQAKIQMPISYQGTAIMMSASIGAAVSPEDGSRLSELIGVADARMYGMKQQRLIA